jgi:hypothetical protein
MDECKQFHEKYRDAVIAGGDPRNLPYIAKCLEPPLGGSRPAWMLAVPLQNTMDCERNSSGVVIACKISKALQDAALADKNASKPPDNTVADHERIQTQYAGYSALSDSGKKIKEVTNSLRVPRPPVQPNPIKTERDNIFKSTNMAVIQTALFSILLALVTFLVVPGQYATGVVFLILCTGISVGIYLSSR